MTTTKTDDDERCCGSLYDDGPIPQLGPGEGPDDAPRCPKKATKWYDEDPGDPENGPDPCIVQYCDEHAAEYERDRDAADAAEKEDR